MTRSSNDEVAGAEDETVAADARIEAVGAYAPRYRVDSETVAETWGTFHGAGISSTAVPAADEDVLTMAAEAASLALSAAGASEPRPVGAADGVAIDRLYVGTTTPPDEEEGIAPRLASVLGLPSAVETRQFAGGTRSGVDALASALDASAAGLADAARAADDGGAADAAGDDSGDDPGRTLVVASDAPRGAPDDEVEHAGGAGAAAVLLGPDGAGRVTGRAERVEAFPGTRFRPPGSDETTGLGVTGYERRAFVDTVAAAAEALDAIGTTHADAASAVADADAVCLRSPNGKLPYRAAGAIGVDAERLQAGTRVHDLGDAGAAGVLVGFANALEAGHEDVVLIGYGSGGGAAAMSVDAAGVPSRTALEGDVELSYGASLRMRGEITTGEPEGGGAYVSVPSWKRTLPQRHRLVAGRCRECGALAFPPSGACTACGTLDDYEEVRLPGTGTVEAVTAIGQGGAPPEFVEQQSRAGAFVSAVVALDGPDGDGTVSVPTQVITLAGDGSTDADDVAIGDRVEATIRRIYTQEGVTRYGFKMRRPDDADG